MIAEKIESVVKALKGLEHIVSPGHWSTIKTATGELEDAAESARHLEALKPITPGRAIDSRLAERRVKE